MKVEFSREEIVTRSYSMSLSRFMEQAFHEAQVDYWDGNKYLRVGIQGLHDGWLRIIYTIPLTADEEKLDFEDKKNVKSVLSRYLKEKQSEKDSFSL